MVVNAKSISADKLNQDLDSLDVALLDLLELGRKIVNESGATITDAAQTAGQIVTYKQATDPVIPPEGGTPTPGSPAHWEPIDAATYAELQDRLILVGKLVNLLDKPIGNATYSYAQQIMARASRWRASRP